MIDGESYRVSVIGGDKSAKAERYVIECNYYTFIIINWL